MDQVKVGKFIAKLRKEKGMTQEELAEHFGLTGKAVSRWECGNGVPDISIVNEVSEVLGVSTTELLNGERVNNIDSTNIDELTENSISFYKSILTKKFNKRINVFIAIILILSFTILSLFWVNNFDKCQFYSIISDSSDFSLSGLLVVNNKRKMIIINNIESNNKNIDEKIKIERCILYVDDDILFEYIPSNIVSGYIPLYDFFDMFSIFIDDLSDDEIKKLLSDSSYIVFNFFDHNDTYERIIIPLKFIKDFSNSKLFY